MKAALDRNAPADELDKETDKLMDEWQKVGAKMHQQAGPQTRPLVRTPSAVTRRAAHRATAARMWWTGNIGRCDDVIRET